MSDSYSIIIQNKGMLVVPFYHPAAALHRPSLRSVVEEDLAKLPDLIKNAEKAPLSQPEILEEENNDQAEQLSLFY